MMKKQFTLLVGLLVVSLTSFSQALASKDRNPDIPVFEGIDAKKGILDLKMKSTIKDKNAILTNYSVTFYTTAHYKYGESGAGGKVGQQIGLVLKGVGDEDFKEITKVTGEYLMEKMKNTGYTLDDINKFYNGKKFEKIKEKSSPAGVAFETQNPNYVGKRVMAKTFTLNDEPLYPSAVGTPAYFQVVSSMKATMATAKFNINFVSIGHDIKSKHFVSGGGITEGKLGFQNAIHGSGEFNAYTPKAKYGSVAIKGDYRHNNLDVITITDTIEDGYYVAQADPAKYKEYSISLIKGQIDLMFDYISSL